MNRGPEQPDSASPEPSWFEVAYRPLFRTIDGSGGGTAGWPGPAGLSYAGLVVAVARRRRRLVLEQLHRGGRPPSPSIDHSRDQQAGAAYEQDDPANGQHRRH